MEKALKAAYIKKHEEDHPFTHDLVYLVELLGHPLNAKTREDLEQLSSLAVDACYNDPRWAAEEATAENARKWIGIAEPLLTSFLHGT